MNTRAKGNYYRTRTKQWYEQHGYRVEVIENKVSVWVRGKILYAPKDIFGVDFLAMNDQEIIFIQCKTNPSDISKAIHEFKKYEHPPCVRQEVVRWEQRGREPKVVVVE